MTEIFKNIIYYLEQIYDFPLYQSLIIMLVIAALYFTGCLFIPGTRRKVTHSVVISGLLLSFYVSQVIGVTLLNRTMTEEARYDLNMIDVYRIAFEGNSVFMTQLIGNVLLFVPFGILVPVCFRRARGVLKMVAVSFMFSLFIETTQLYTHTGLFELVDLLNNTTGGFIGYLIFKVCYGGYKILKSCR